MPTPPTLNAIKSQREWDSDRATAKSAIFEWLAEASKCEDLRAQVETELGAKLLRLSGSATIADAIEQDPTVLTVLRALTRRDIGTSQMATILGIGTGALESFEAAKKTTRSIGKAAAPIIERELDMSVARWIVEGRHPDERELLRTVIVASDRIIRRETSTTLRYKHEPRQLAALKRYLDPLGYREVKPNVGTVDPRVDLEPGTYAFRVNVEGLTQAGVPLKQNVDTLLMPHTGRRDLLPVFIEAKSMTDEANPNKRQKEEAQKVAAVRSRWEGTGETLNFILLLGGTVPMRYLEVERGSGLDWIWEHRVSDLQPLLEWYRAA